MSETILIDALAGTLPESFCPKGPTALQELYEQFVNSTRWSLAVGLRFFNFGDTVPTPDFRSFPWLKTVGGYPDRFYVFISGDWLSLHQIPAGPSGFRCGWTGSEDELKTYDGGDAGLPTTLTTGPFWEIDHDFDGRSPMGPGAIPASDPAKTLGVGENFGEGSHVQTEAELAPHTHNYIYKYHVDQTVEDGSGEHGVEKNLFHTIDAVTESTGGGAAMSLVHPVRGLFQIKRTIRKYYRGT